MEDMSCDYCGEETGKLTYWRGCQVCTRCIREDIQAETDPWSLLYATDADITEFL